MSQSCYIVAVWHHLKTNSKQILHKIKQNAIAKKYRYIGIMTIIGIFFSGIGFRVFFQIPQQPTQCYKTRAKLKTIKVRSIPRIYLLP
jgi:hypothetical protein